MTINVILEGGLVQHVVSTDKEEIGQAINIIDYDTDGAENSEITIVDGNSAIVSEFIVGEQDPDLFNPSEATET